MAVKCTKDRTACQNCTVFAEDENIIDNLDLTIGQVGGIKDM